MSENELQIIWQYKRENQDVDDELFGKMYIVPPGILTAQKGTIPKITAEKGE